MSDSADDYLDTNRRSWDTRAAQHVRSDFYDVDGWLAGATSLKPIERALLGEVAGCEVAHLMCHFGQDTLSLARLGARVTGLDLSPVAVAEARALATRAGLAAEFVEGDVLRAPELLGGRRFDLVFMSYGTIGWLPDVRAWAQTVAACLRPGGRLVFVEFHPALWMLDEDFAGLKYRYFTGEPIVTDETSYAPVAGEAAERFVSWNHGLGEVVGALLAEGLRLGHFAEYDYSPYDIFGGRGVERARGEWVIAGLEGIVPLVYSLVAEAP